MVCTDSVCGLTAKHWRNLGSRPSLRPDSLSAPGEFAILRALPSRIAEPYRMHIDRDLSLAIRGTITKVGLYQGATDEKTLGEKNLT